MREYFRGWRMKSGVVVLTLACLFIGAWVRSLIVRDLVRIPFQNGFNQGTISEISTEPGIVNVYWFAEPNFVPSGSLNPNPTPTLPTGAVINLDAVGEFIEDKLGAVTGFETYETEAALLISNTTMTAEFAPTFVIPFWPIVISLTLISAWLLLGNRWKKGPKPTSEPLNT